jgi:hypothetical protein
VHVGNQNQFTHFHNTLLYAPFYFVFCRSECLGSKQARNADDPNRSLCMFVPLHVRSDLTRLHGLILASTASTRAVSCEKVA